jgi:uncharacterized protein (TIGR02996 family)
MSSQLEREGLLDAIRAAPEDDTPRLVYADWLDDHDDAPRAAFIRAQVKAARLRREADEAGLPHPSEAGRLDKDADRLMRKNKAAFLAGLPVGNGFAIYFARGMPEDAVPKDGKEFLKRADKAFAAAPIRTLSFSDINPELLEKAIATGHIRRVESISLHVRLANRDTPWAEMVRLLGASADISGLRRLSLRQLYRPPADLGTVARALGEGKHWKSLRSLQLTIGGHLDLDGIQALARLKNLEELLLAGRTGAGPGLGRGVVVELARAFPKLHVLAFRAPSFGDDAATAFAESSKLKHLQTLVGRERCSITDPEALLRLVASPKLASLTKLELEGAPLTGRIPTSAIKSRGPTLRVLDLERCGLNGAGVAALCALPALRGLTMLDLSQNDMGAVGARAIAAAPWERLTLLRLSEAGIGAEGAAALASSPALASLRHLGLYENGLGDEGMRAIAASPHLGGLNSLYFGSNGEPDAETRRALKDRYGSKGWSSESFERPG